jgi:hypothetical protein
VHPSEKYKQCHRLKDPAKYRKCVEHMKRREKKTSAGGGSKKGY